MPASLADPPDPSDGRLVEPRRACRVGGRFWLRVGGVDAAARLRAGNLSVTGLYVTMDEAVGSPGDLVSLSLASADKARSAQTMARVARVVRQDDLTRGAAIVGAGFEFLPLERPHPEIVELLRHAADLAIRTAGMVTFERECTVRIARRAAPPVVARPRSLGRDTLVLAATARLGPGEAVTVDLSPREAPPLQGRVVACEAPLDGAGPSFRITVRLRRQPDDVPAAARLVESLVAPTSLSTPPPRLQDLSGQLSRVRVGSVLAFASNAGLDGIVIVANEVSSARVYLSAGRVVDAELDHRQMPAEEALRELLGWSEGEFSVVHVPVRRSDRLERVTPSLIADLLRPDPRVA